MRILLVEDTPDLGEAILQHFQSSGHALDWVTTVSEAKAAIATDSDNYDLVILDIMLPDGTGADILKVRKNTDPVLPIVVLTARSQVADRVQFLDLGADDYITKPFHFDELDARCRAVLRRHQGKSNNLITYGKLELDVAGKTVWCVGEQLPLRSRELRLLEALLVAPTSILSKSQLLEKLYSLEEEPSENAIEVYIGRLRKKLHETGVSIETVRGLGYRLSNE